MVQPCTETNMDEESGKSEISTHTVGPPVKVYSPRDWPVPRKVLTFVVLFMLAFVSTYSSGAYSPSISGVQKHLGGSTEVAQLGTSLFMFGIAFGSLIWGPLGQTIGRRPVFLIAYSALTAFNVGVCVAQNMATILVCRFFAGFCGAAAFSNLSASINDFTTVRERNPYNSFFRFATFSGPVLAALLGSVAVRDSDWRWNLRSLPISVFVALVIYAITGAETSPQAVAANAQRYEADRQALDATLHEEKGMFQRFALVARNHLPSRASLRTLAQAFRYELSVPWILLFEEPVVMVACFYTSMLYGLLYGTLLFFPYVWTTLRGFDQVQTGYTYFAMLASFLLYTVVLGCRVQHVAFQRAFDKGEQYPELRIQVGSWSLLTVPIGLFIFAWTGPFEHVHWIAPIIGIFILSFGMMYVFSSWLAYLGDSYGNNAAAVIGINTFLRSLVAGAFPLFTHQMVTRMTFQGAMSMFGGVSIPLTVVGYVFCVYGPKLRARSKHAVHE